MESRQKAFGALVAAALALGAVPVAGQEQDEDGDSDELAGAMMCGSAYRVVAERSKGLAAAKAYDASHAMISELASLLGVEVEDEQVRSRMKYSNEVVDEMLASGESLGEMVAECNGAYGLDIAVE